MFSFRTSALCCPRINSQDIKMAVVTPRASRSRRGRVDVGNTEKRAQLVVSDLIGPGDGAVPGAGCGNAVAIAVGLPYELFLRQYGGLNLEPHGKLDTHVIAA